MKTVIVFTFNLDNTQVLHSLLTAKGTISNYIGERFLAERSLDNIMVFNCSFTEDEKDKIVEIVREADPSISCLFIEGNKNSSMVINDTIKLS